MARHVAEIEVMRPIVFLHSAAPTPLDFMLRGWPNSIEFLFSQKIPRHLFGTIGPILHMPRKTRLVGGLAMHDIDVSKLSLKELKALQLEIGKALDDHEAQIRGLALAAVRAVAKKHGFSLEELMRSSESVTASRPPKYFDLDDPSLTWSGRGRPPTWFTEAIEAGNSAKSMLMR